MKDILHRALSSANVPSRLEPTGLDQIVSVPMESPWYHGRIELLVWDATCVDTLPLPTASELCATANQAEQTTIKNYTVTSPPMHTIPSHLLPSKQLECVAFAPCLSYQTWVTALLTPLVTMLSGIPPAKVFCCHSEGECCISQLKNNKNKNSL